MLARGKQKGPCMRIPLPEGLFSPGRQTECEAVPCPCLLSWHLLRRQFYLVFSYLNTFVFALRFHRTTVPIGRVGGLLVSSKSARRFFLRFATGVTWRSLQQHN